MTTRDIVQEHFIQAAPATVWAAFTEGQHIRNWFAPFADSDPRLGGYIHLQWDEAVGGGQQCVITEWEVERRLVMTWRDAPDEVGKLPVEVTLQARDGGTLLTLTHSGFLSDASWDDEFDSHVHGR